jgi:hypothetical protein
MSFHRFFSTVNILWNTSKTNFRSQVRWTTSHKYTYLQHNGRNYWHSCMFSFLLKKISHIYLSSNWLYIVFFVLVYSKRYGKLTIFNTYRIFIPDLRKVYIYICQIILCNFAYLTAVMSIHCWWKSCDN